jgi:crossover junction endodeoxyribonuclease RusA
VRLYELPYPPTINTYWRSVKGRVLISKAGREYRQTVCQCTRHTKTIPLNCRLSVEIDAYMPDKRKRDIDNLPKAILDSLSHAGVWVDDSQIDELKITRMGVEKPGSVFVRISRFNHEERENHAE